MNLPSLGRNQWPFAGINLDAGLLLATAEIPAVFPRIVTEFLGHLAADRPDFFRCADLFCCFAPRMRYPVDVQS